MGACLRFNFEATGIGSVPFKDPETACGIIFDNFPSIPFWPQLSRRSYHENMYAQYSERLPGFIFDLNSKTVKFNVNLFIRQIDEVIRKYNDNDLDKLIINYGAGEKKISLLPTYGSEHPNRLL